MNQQIAQEYASHGLAYDQENRCVEIVPPEDTDTDAERLADHARSSCRCCSRAGVAATIGGMGLTVAGTAVYIGAAPVIAAGAIVGLAGYGVYKLLGGK